MDVSKVSENMLTSSEVLICLKYSLILIKRKISNVNQLALNAHLAFQKSAVQ